MLDNASKAFFHLLARSGTLKNAGVPLRHARSRRASRAGSSPARRSRKRSPPRARVEAQRPAADARLPRRERRDASPKPTPPRATTCRSSTPIIAVGHRPQPVAEADAARARRRSRQRRRQPAPHPRPRARGSSCASTWRARRTPSVTLDIFETLWQQGYRQIGVVLQADLHRTEQDVERINALGARIRLVKGAYREPQSVAYPEEGATSTPRTRG